MAARGFATPDERLNELPIEALECRDLRHAWPRTSSGAAKLVPTKRRGTRVVEAQREMECTGGCGTVRVEDFEILADGRVLRVGQCRYRRTRPYLLKRDDPADSKPPVDRDEVRFALLARLYPDFSW